MKNSILIKMECDLKTTLQTQGMKLSLYIAIIAVVFMLIVLMFSKQQLPIGSTILTSVVYFGMVWINYVILFWLISMLI
jgi:uncharacterized membrane protein (UPF0136 family)